MKKRSSSLKAPLAAVIAAIMITIIALFPAASYIAFAAEAGDAEIYAFSAEDEAAEDAGPAYDGMDIGASYEASYTDMSGDYVEEPDTSLAAGKLDEATKDEIAEYRRQNVSDSLKIMGQGMLGIFVVMFLIYLVVVILNAVTKEPPEEEEDNSN